MKFIAILLLFAQITVAQSTTVVSTSHILTDHTNITSNIDADVQYSNSSRLQISLSVTADIDLRLLEYLTKSLVITVTKNNKGVYNIHIPKFKETIVNSKPIEFTYKLKLIIPRNKELASR